MPREYIAHVCFMFVVVTVWGLWECLCVAAALLEIVFFFAVLKYVVCLCRGCDGCCVFCLYCNCVEL